MNDSSTVSLQPAILEIGTALHADALRSQPRFFRARGLRGAVVGRALEDETLRRALFQFVDVLPELRDATAVARHFSAYIAGRELGGAWGRILRLGAQPFMAWAVRSSVERTARLFLVEEDRSALTRLTRALARSGAQITVDAVGEAVLTEAEADHYAERYVRLIDWQQNAGSRPHVSLKLSGLTPRFDPVDPPGSIARVLDRAAPLMQRVLATNAALTIDMEHHELKPLVLDTFKALVERYPEGAWQPGIALQAYLPETQDDLARLFRWVRSHRRPVTVRLVKGAYWDTEVANTRQREWPVPVYLHKSETDASYERLTRTLFENADLVFPAIAGHNLRSLAHAIAAAEAAGLPRDRWEIQMLHGMAEPLQTALAQRDVSLRIYVPTGELVTGIAYLIRRLLENTASSSILRQTYAEAQDTAVLLAAPETGLAPVVESAPTGAFRSTPVLDFSRQDVREQFNAALASLSGARGARYPLAVNGATTTEAYRARNPARPDDILGEVELTDASGARAAIANANEAGRAWRKTPPAERIAMMRRAAVLMLDRRMELAAWQVLEQAKNRREADADVAEAIDYLNYYAAEMERLQGWKTTIQYPGETNATRFEPRGTAVIISPWNFPLAILAGMTSAALVTGNCAIMKPAMPAQIVAHLFHRVLLEAGFPPDVCQLVPGHGAAVGDVLVDDPRVHMIAFTGSREIGQRILERAARFSPRQEHVKRVVCEMGGKNAIIVDDDADLDEVVRETVHSAFGYQGQKCSACSRLIAVGGIHDRLLARLTAALDAWPYGPPEDPQYVFGPLITEAAQAKTLEYIEIGKSEGRLVYQGRVPETGYYVAPAIFAGIRPEHRIAQEEIFGPVLAVMHAETLAQAIDIALDSRYALTGGVFSRLPHHLELAREQFHVGDLYLNRRITGARVGAQPFGGYRLSGTGIQAGGEDYLKQFMWSRVVTENTIRHGYVPT